MERLQPVIAHTYEQHMRSMKICKLTADKMDVQITQDCPQAGMIGWFMGKVRLGKLQDGNLSCYCVDTEFSKTDVSKRTQNEEVAPQVEHVIVDALDFRVYKLVLAENHPETLMSFINHGCPGCDNVEIPEDKRLTVTGQPPNKFGPQNMYSFKIPVVVAKHQLFANDVLRYDYGPSFCASSKPELEMQGYKNPVACNCPLHKDPKYAKKFPWFLPNSDEKPEKEEIVLNEKTLECMQRNTHEVYQGMIAAAASKQHARR